MASLRIATYTELLSDIKGRKLANVYILHGDESYFIDELVKRFEEVIPEGERDFNLYQLYAPQVKDDMGVVVSTCRRLPVMAPLQMVILKECQSVSKRDLAKLAPYIAKPSPSTVLVMVHRGVKLDSKPLFDALKESGVAFESKKPTERNISSHVEALAKQFGVNIEQRGISMLTEHLGLDLAKMANEIEKLSLILGQGSTVTPEAIEMHVGISKEYNNFELVNAIAMRDLKKALTIIDYFRSNPKPNPPIVTGSTIFNHFANVVIAQFTPDKSEANLKNVLGLRWGVQLNPVLWTMKRYNAWQTLEIISLLRRFDAYSKGNGSRGDAYDLLTDLIYKIFYASGKLS